MAPLKIVIADDHELIRHAVRRTLADTEDVALVGEAASGAEVLPLIAATDPDVVLLDLRMPHLDGLSCLEQIRARYPRVKVLVLSACSDSRQIGAALKRGACGYVLKTINPLDLASAIRQSVEGSFFNALSGAEDAERAAVKASGLSKRELSILAAVARGLSNQEIARELWVSEQTIKFHLGNIYRKLGVANRTEAARYAHEQGLLDPPLEAVA